jgi:hypothetical protein
MTDRVKEIVDLKGNKGAFKTDKVIDLDSNSFMLNSKRVSGCVIIRFLGAEIMYNKHGDDFSFSELEHDDLAELVDVLETL